MMLEYIKKIKKIAVLSKLFKIVLILIILQVETLPIQAQVDSVSLAEELFENQNFDQAIVFYKNFMKLDPNNPDVYYKLGFCYLNTPDKRDSAIAPIKKSLYLYQHLSKKKRKKIYLSPIQIKYDLARAYRLNYQFDSALAVLKTIDLDKIPKKIKAILQNEMQLCIDGKNLYANPKDIKIENLGTIINTQYTEHTPVFTPDEEELYFTSRRKLFADSKKDYDNEYDENIYYSKKDSSGNWTKPVPLTNIDTRDHEATVSISFDGKTLFIYKDEDNGSIYYSKYINGNWSAPVKMSKVINTKYRETSVSLSVDGTTLFFTSDRPGGYGGLDIYMTKKLPDGTWGVPVNLGPAINTSKDEEAPYILPDGKTLYFSSKGHGGMGGYDIFKDTINQFGTWAKPQNLGYPINSFEDDVFYFPTPDQRRAYFTSKKTSGKNYGSSDIYYMYLPESNASDLIIVKGLLAVCKGDLPHADIQITEKSSGKNLVVSPKNGKFLFPAYKGKTYNIYVATDDTVVYNKDFTVPLDAPRVMLYKAIRLDPDVPCNKKIENVQNTTIDPRLIGPDGTIYDQFVEIQNILFPLNQVGKISPNASLDTLVSYLKRNPKAVIEVGGYCDASGRAEYNYKLGLKRALAVKNYLVSKGVPENQVVAVSYGEENPIAINKNPDGSWNKKGQHYNRRVEFRLLKQGEESLIIYGMKVPDDLKNPNYKFNYKKAPTNDVETLN